MRRLAVAGVVLTVIGLFTIGLMRIRPSPPRAIRFENPSTVVSDGQPGAVFEYVLSVLSRLNAGQFQEARQLTGHLEKASVPPDVQAMLSELTDALGKEVSLMDVVERWIRDITTLMQAGRTADAQRLLQQIDLQVRRADLLLADLSGGAQVLRARTQPSLEANPAQQKAFDDLQRAAARIKGLLTIYRATAKTPQAAAAVGRLLPYETVIDITAPAVAHPGRLVEISGQIRERAPAPFRSRRATVELDGQPVVEISAGTVHVQFALPDDIASGPHELQIRVPEQGRYRSARWTKTIQVSRVIPRLNASSPTWVTVPGRFNITGSVISELGPLHTAAIQVRIAGNGYDSTTSDSGSFRVVGDLPAALSLGGATELSITVAPREPWHAPITETHRLFMVNLISAGALAALFVGGIGFALKQGNERAQVVTPPPVTQPVGRTLAHARPAALTQVTGSLAEEIVAIYKRVVRQLEAASGIQGEVTATLREFVHRLSLRTGGETLWRLTVLTEWALYSPHPVTPDQVEVARTLSGQLEEALRRAP